MTAPSLFDSVRIDDCETSVIAASKDRTTDRARCLEALRAAGDEGLTDFELGEKVGRQQTSAGCRRNSLVKDGLVEWAGITRPAPSGSPARVWRIVA